MNARIHFYAYALLFYLFVPASGMNKKHSVDHEAIQSLLTIYEQGRVSSERIVPLLEPYTYQQQVNWTDSLGRSFLHLAAAKGDAPFVKTLIVELGANCSLADGQGQTALAVAQASFCSADESDYEAFDDCVLYLADPEKLIAETVPDEQRKKCTIQ